MAWLLDTNVLSELRRLRPEPKVVDFVAGQPTAIQRGLTVVTRDRSDYDRAGVPVVNPWEAS
jgi:predicted nucleic acid-binding protein